jgi:hypothetical protein
MHLWTRTIQVDVRQGPDAFPFVADVARWARSATGLEIVPWTGLYGVPLGTIVYSAEVDSQAAMAAALATLAANPADRRIGDSARAFHCGGGQDAIGEIVSVAGPGGTVGNFASVVIARCPMGRIAEATTWGIDILSHGSKLTGLDGSFVRSLYGPGARTFAWISLAETMDEVDDAAAALAADASYLERIDDAGPLFLPGSPSQHLLRRLS